jgi:hypothetical protein
LFLKAEFAVPATPDLYDCTPLAEKPGIEETPASIFPSANFISDQFRGTE